MSIKKIKVSNFKGFKNLEVKLSKFNVFIGANAAGKSSFVQLFDFIRNIPKNGLSNAISMQGGVEYLKNINIGNDKPFSFEILFDRPKIRKVEKEYDNKTIFREAYETKYKFSLKFNRENTDDFIIIEDKLEIKFKYFENGEDYEKEKEIGEAIVVILRDKEKLDVKIKKKNLDNITDFKLERDSIIPPFFIEMELKKKELILESPLVFLIEPPLKEVLGGISIYDINPTLPKKATPITGKAELEENGENLAIVLKNIVENKENRRKFSNLIKDILPFVNDMDVEKFADKSLLFKLEESYVKDKYIPASLLSDGTINITALIIALYFEEKRIAIIEEPERNIHPHLISRVVEMLNDASSKKQVIITTHNPEIVKHIDLKNLFLVYRDKDGFSKISKPIEKEEVKTFLSNDMGIDDLYIQNLLEV